MARHRTHSVAFKKQVVQEYLSGESLHGLARRYSILIPIRGPRSGRLATAESQAQWELILTDRYRRGLEGQALELICVDGGAVNGGARRGQMAA